MSYRILSQDCLADNNSHATGLNNNDLIVGPSGAGKTRGYVLPNILQCSESFIVADTKNSLRAETEAVLRQNGYKVLSHHTHQSISTGIINQGNKYPNTVLLLQENTIITKKLY